MSLRSMGRCRSPQTSPARRAARRSRARGRSPRGASRARVIAPLQQFHARAPESIDRPSSSSSSGDHADRGRRSDRRTPSRRIVEAPLDPVRERLVEQPFAGLRSRLRRPDRSRLDRTLAEEFGAEPVNGADVCFFEPMHGALQALPRPSLPGADVDRARSSSSRNRSFSSPAAFSLKVTATICSIARRRPVSMSRTTRLTSSVVLPVPAAASTMRVSSSASQMR